MTNHRVTALLPYTSLIMGIVFLSISPLFVRWADAPGVVTSFFRMVTATSVLGVIVFLQRIPKNPHSNTKAIWLWPILGGVFSAIDHALWSTSIENTFVANATLLNYIAPLWVSLVAIFILREVYAGYFWLGLLMVLSGAWIVTGVRLIDFASISINGEGFAFLSSFFYAGYFIVSQRALQYYSVTKYVLISSGVAMLGLLIILLVSGFSVFSYSKETYMFFIVAGLFSQLGGYFSINFALKHISAPIVSSILILQPVLTALLAVRLASEGINHLQLLGGLLVLGGVFIVKAAKKEPNP